MGDAAEIRDPAIDGLKIRWDKFGAGNKLFCGWRPGVSATEDALRSVFESRDTPRSDATAERHRDANDAAAAAMRTAAVQDVASVPTPRSGAARPVVSDIVLKASHAIVTFHDSVFPDVFMGGEAERLVQGTPIQGLKVRRQNRGDPCTLFCGWRPTTNATSDDLRAVFESVRGRGTAEQPIVL